MRKESPNAYGLFILLLTVAIIFFLMDIALGPVPIPFKEIIKIIFGHGSDSISWNNIIEKIRIPKAETAVLAGLGLSVSGLLMQTLFRNPLSGPEVLGVTSGASLGVSLVMLASGGILSAATINQLDLAGGWILVTAASLGSALILLIILAIANKIKDNVTLLIIGIMVGTLTISLVGLLLYFSSPEQTRDYLMWTFGSIGGVTGSHLSILAGAVLLGLILSLTASKSLNMLLLGENYARTMGLEINKARVLIILATSFLAGSITAFCGPIGFVGLAVPHLCRAIFNTSDHLKLIIASSLMGPILMLVCDILGQLPGSQTLLPINFVTSFLGAPVVIWVIVSKRQAKRSF